MDIRQLRNVLAIFDKGSIGKWLRRSVFPSRP